MAKKQDVPPNLRAEPMTFERHVRPSPITVRNQALRDAQDAGSMAELKEAAQVLQVDTTGARSKQEVVDRIEEATGADITPA